MTSPTLGWAVTAALTAATAVALLARPRPRTRLAPAWVPGPVAWWLGVVLLVTAGLLTAQRLSLRVGALVVVAAGVAVAGRALWRRRLRRQEVELGQARVLDFCQQLAAELQAGQPPGTALERAARGWPQLQPVASAFRLGGDVPTGLRLAAQGPGLHDLGLAAAAWQVAHRSGGGLSAAVLRVATGLRATQATRRVVRAELASARATARLMAGLPVLALLMGSGIGGDPLAFLFGSPWGLACLVAGLALQFGGLWWIEAIADAVATGAS